MKKRVIKRIAVTLGAVICITQSPLRAEPRFASLEVGDRQVTLDYLHWFKALPDHMLRDVKAGNVSVSTNRYGGEYRKLLDGEGNWLQRSWIAQGYAIYNGMAGINTEWRISFLEAERQAQKQKLGYWASHTVRRATNSNRINVNGSFQVIEGVVQSVGKSKGWIYLNFGSNWRTDFTAAIPPKNKAIFKSKGWKLAELENISVRVRGYVRKYNGPFMELYFPEQIELSNED
ncbi:hypothetical protein GUA87_06770 [Sneathiella sp. P13V-1]|uniref:hypothetical protein n=1 Tax=Sneathiella sp. P13V-1 TaxID=2697366 RepID=UPI00187B22D1|nr:hypothetical protein [Sneathiella sp. P13V-1]MBE7636543.1 hypothetical protein [Sneathiella sp. P13V-1]